MRRELSEPDAYLRRNAEADPRPKREPYPHWRETKAERIERLAGIHAELFAEPNIVTFGEQLQRAREFQEWRKAQDAIPYPRCVY